AEFTEAIGALYGMAFTIKMTRKFAGTQDYSVGKLEARWPGFEGKCPAAVNKDEWTWELLIRTPEFVRETDLKQARATLKKRGKDGGTERVELLRLDEGLCVQALHTGPYEEEERTFQAMLEYAAGKGYQAGGAHGEIYLSDPRRVEPRKLKTILRVPLRATA
ncbi:MAG: GyrI-like domain-containing protein, partial [Terracidiphilus sp.]